MLIINQLQCRSIFSVFKGSKSIAVQCKIQCIQIFVYSFVLCIKLLLSSVIYQIGCSIAVTLWVCTSFSIQILSFRLLKSRMHLTVTLSPLNVSADFRALQKQSCNHHSAFRLQNPSILSSKPLNKKRSSKQYKFQ